uniref:hypothetical protein n=1 Tax=Catelliglobosispora koreensis TaxID=129052 RepID=UPI0005918291
MQPAFASKNPRDYVPGNVRLIEAVKNHRQNNPHDYVGLNRAIVEAGGSPVSFNISSLGLENLSPEQAQAAVDSHKQRSSTSAATTQMSTMGIGGNEIVVDGYWSKVDDGAYGTWYTYFGSWDFTDEGTDDRWGGTPWDAFGLVTSQINLSCFKMDGQAGYFSARDNVHQALVEALGGPSQFFGIKDAGPEFILFRVADWVDDKTAYVDNGWGYISYKVTNPCDDMALYGKTVYERNDNGCNCSWNFGVDASTPSGMGFNISYAGSDLPEALPFSTDAKSIWTGDPCVCSPGGGGSGTPQGTQIYETASDRAWNNLPVDGASGAVKGSAVAALNYGGTKLIYTLSAGKVYEAASSTSWLNQPTGISGVTGTAIATINSNNVKYIYTIINGKVYEASSANGWTNLWTGIEGVSSG